MPGLASRSLLSSLDPQSVFLTDDEPRLQYSFPAPLVVPRLYQPPSSHPSTYSNNPTASSPINVSENRPQNEIWQPDPRGDASATNRLPEAPFFSFPLHQSSLQPYPIQRPPQGMLPVPRSSIPLIHTSTIVPAGNLQRDPVSVERTATRSSAHTTTSPNPHHPPSKRKRKRENPEQVRVLDEVYARTTIPSMEQQQELAVRLDMTLEEVQIWYISFFTVSTVHLMSPSGLKKNECLCVSDTAGRPQLKDPDLR